MRTWKILLLALTMLMVATATAFGQFYPWDGSELLESDPGSVVSQRIDFDPLGGAWAIWSQNLPGINFWRNINYSYRAPGSGAWTRAAILRASIPSGSQPDVAFEPNGNVLVVWEENGSGTARVAFRRYDAAKRDWTPVTYLNRAGLYFNVRIEADGKGRAVAIWMEQFMPPYPVAHLWGSAYDPGTGTWSAPTLLQEELKASGSLARLESDFSMAPTGEGMVVWSQDVNGENHVHAMELDSALHTGPVKEVQSQRGEGGYARVAMSARGIGLAVWHQGPYRNEDVWAAAFDPNSGGWAVPVQLAQRSATPEVAAAQEGEFFVTWAGENYCSIPRKRLKIDVFAQQFDIVQGWNPTIWKVSLCNDPDPVDPNYIEFGYVLAPKIAANDTGKVIVVWDQEDPSNSIFHPVTSVWSRMYRWTKQMPGRNIPPMRLWTVAREVDDSTVPIHQPDVDMSDFGEVGAVWGQESAPQDFDAWANFTR